MFDDIRNPSAAITGDEAFDVLRELERNRPEEIRRQRSHFRLSIKSSIILQPGNQTDMLSFKVKGVTGDISAGGCSALFPVPARVGDIYRLVFDRKTLDLPLTFARCVRCRLVREDAFEAGFAFFSPISLPDNVAAAESVGLG